MEEPLRGSHDNFVAESSVTVFEILASFVVSSRSCLHQAYRSFIEFLFVESASKCATAEVDLDREYVSLFQVLFTVLMISCHGLQETLQLEDYVLD